jgi:hypothetical protein
MLDGIPITNKVQKAEIDKPNPRLGVGLIGWSCDGALLLTRNGKRSSHTHISLYHLSNFSYRSLKDTMPSVIWIWDVQTLKLISIISQMEPVKSAKWDPLHHRIAICTGRNSSSSPLLFHSLNHLQPSSFSFFSSELKRFGSTGNNKLYLWTPNGCSCIEIPAGNNLFTLLFTLTLTFERPSPYRSFFRQLFGEQSPLE